ncbi:hypothetical protein ACLOJK_018253 [Asimina triloba]
MISNPISRRKQTLVSALALLIYQRRFFSSNHKHVHASKNPNATSSAQGKNRNPFHRPRPSLDRPPAKPRHSNLPFDFRYSYTESGPLPSATRPIRLREPNYSPFGPGRIDRVWDGVCAQPTSASVGGDRNLVAPEAARKLRERILGEPLSDAERKALVDKCQRSGARQQLPSLIVAVTLNFLFRCRKLGRIAGVGRDGLTHNMLNVIHNHWNHAEAIRIKCMGVPTVDMENICSQLEDKTGGQIIYLQGGLIILFRGRHYNPKKRPFIPVMLWKPSEPIYPRLIRKVIDGLPAEQTEEMRKRGLMIPALVALAKNGFYGNLVPMVQEAFLTDELVRIDCNKVDKSDYRKLGSKLRDLVPCVLVTFEEQQIVVWRGKDHSSEAVPVACDDG